MRRSVLLAAGSLLSSVLVDPALARLERVRIDSVTPAPPPAKAGALRYEIVRGQFFGSLDPADPHNGIITDIAGATRDARGRVGYSATFAIARPIDRTKASGVLFYDVPNRGGWPIAGDPDGHVRVISGWQGDLPAGPDVQRASVPVAHGPGGAR